jgi:antitoxin HicB
MFYPAVLTRDGDGWMVAFPDIPEALTSGATREEALEMAKDALKTAMEFYFEERRPVPLPSKVTRGQDAVELEPSVAAKVLLLNEIVKQNVRPTDLARKLGTTPQENRKSPSAGEGRGAKPAGTGQEETPGRNQSVIV